MQHNVGYIHHQTNVALAKMPWPLGKRSWPWIFCEALALVLTFLWGLGLGCQGLGLGLAILSLDYKPGEFRMNQILCELHFAQRDYQKPVNTFDVNLGLNISHQLEKHPDSENLSSLDILSITIIQWCSQGLNRKTKAMTLEAWTLDIDINEGWWESKYQVGPTWILWTQTNEVEQ